MTGSWFSVLKAFEDEDTGTYYCPGLRYVIRPGNDELAAKVAIWCHEGKVRMVATGGTNHVRGQGVVK